MGKYMYMNVKVSWGRGEVKGSCANCWLLVKENQCWCPQTSGLSWTVLDVPSGPGTTGTWDIPGSPSYGISSVARFHGPDALGFSVRVMVYDYGLGLWFRVRV